MPPKNRRFVFRKPLSHMVAKGGRSLYGSGMYLTPEIQLSQTAGRFKKIQGLSYRGDIVDANDLYPLPG